MAEVEVSRDGAVQTITLNRPDKLNAFTRGVHEELQAALEEARDPAVRAVVITGAGRGFSAGQDLTAFGEAGDIAAMLRATYHVNVLAIRSLEKPVIAAVNGVCAGAGLSLACACDIRLASDAAFFVPGFVGIGLIPDSGGSFFLQRLLGTPRAFEWMTSNRRLTAAEAHAWGLVSEVVEADSFAARVAERAAELAAAPTRAIALTKRLYDEAATSTLEEQLEREAAAQAEAAQTDDFREGVAAFGEKRAARVPAGAELELDEAPTSPSSGKRPSLCFEKTSSPSRRRRTGLLPPSRRSVDPVVVQHRPRDSRPVGRTRFRRGSSGSRRPRGDAYAGAPAPSALRGLGDLAEARLDPSPRSPDTPAGAAGTRCRRARAPATARRW